MVEAASQLSVRALELVDSAVVDPVDSASDTEGLLMRITVADDDVAVDEACALGTVSTPRGANTSTQGVVRIWRYGTMSSTFFSNLAFGRCPRSTAL